MKVCCAPLTGRIVGYWAILILLVPYLAQHVIEYFLIETGTYKEMAAEQCISLLLFFLVVPLIWNRMDNEMKKKMAAKKPTAIGIGIGIDFNSGIGIGINIDSGGAEKKKDE
jgi:hypothetical protein